MKETLQGLYALLIPAPLPYRRYNTKHRCTNSDSAEFEDEDLFPVGFSSEGQGLAFVLQHQSITIGI